MNPPDRNDAAERILLATEEEVPPELLRTVLLGLVPEPDTPTALHWYPLADVRADGLEPTLYAGAPEPWMYAQTLRRLARFRLRPRALIVTGGVPADDLAAVAIPLDEAIARGRRREAQGLSIELGERVSWAAATPVHLRPAGSGSADGAAHAPEHSGVVLRAHVNGNGSIAHLSRLLAIALDRTRRAVWLEDLVGKPPSANATMSELQRRDIARLAAHAPGAHDQVVASVRAPYRLPEEALTRGGAFDWPEHAGAPQYMWGGIAYSEADSRTGWMRTAIDSFDRWLAVSTHSRRALLAGGVDPGRVQVLPHPIDDRLFRPTSASRRADGPFTVLNVSVSFGQLKGLDVLLRAATRAFAGERAVVLRIHQRKGGLEELLADDPLAADAFARLGDRVVVTTGPLSQDQLARLYAGADVYVQPSRAEASGLTALEAACCGTPSIATAWSGPTDYIDGKAVLPLSYRLTEARPRRDQPLARGGCGLWAEPSVEHLAELLHELRSEREERAAAAHAAAPALHARFGLEAVGRTAESLLFDAGAWDR